MPVNVNGPQKGFNEFVTETPIAIAARPCTIEGFYCFNDTDAVIWIHFFDLAVGAVNTLGSTGFSTAKFKFPIMENEGLILGEYAMEFDTALTACISSVDYAVTGTYSNNDVFLQVVYR